MKWFWFQWKDGDVEFLQGDNPVKALRAAGYGPWCHPFLYDWGEVKND